MGLGNCFFPVNKKWEKKEEKEEEVKEEEENKENEEITLQCSLPLPCSRVVLEGKAIVFFQ